MSFAQQLGRNVVQAQQRYEIERQQYEAETQRLLQLWVAKIKEKFMAQCEAASHRQELRCTMQVDYPRDLGNRDSVDRSRLQQQLQEVLVELGFQDGNVSAFGRRQVPCPPSGYKRVCQATMSANWAADDSTSTGQERSPKASGGTCVTCPICHEHRPAVVLMPCGHVVCRDCHRCQQLRQCPMCRKVITSASQGLFMD